MQPTRIFYAIFALYLVTALSMNAEASAPTRSVSMTGPNTNSALVALSSMTGKDIPGEKNSKNSKKMTGPRIDISKPDLKMQLTAVHDALKNTRMFSEMPLTELTKLDSSFQYLTQTQSQIDEALKANKAPEENWLRQQEIVNAILDKSEADSRLICMNEKLTGSHRSKRVCRTSAEVARLEQKSKDSWQRRGESQLDAPRVANE